MVSTACVLDENRLMRWLHRVYDPPAHAALRWPRASMALGVVPVLLCVAVFPFLGGEFMPKLEEGNLWIRAIFPVNTRPVKAGTVKLTLVPSGTPAA